MLFPFYLSHHPTVSFILNYDQGALWPSHVAQELRGMGKEKDRQMGTEPNPFVHWLPYSFLSALKFHLWDGYFEQTSKHLPGPGDQDMNQRQFWPSRNSRSRRGDEISAFTIVKSRGSKVIRHYR